MEQFQNAIGKENVETNFGKREEAATATFATYQKIPAILFPKNQTEIQKCLAIANKFKLKIHPVSAGKNWGYGSQVPFTDDTYLLSLKRLNRILEYDEAMGIVKFEAGVTFQQLYNFLGNKGSKLMLGSPGSTLEASVLANTLARGTAQLAAEERANRVVGLEVILPTGEIINTGMRVFPKTKVHHQSGVGASLDGLFFQSNFGIATQMTLSLPPLPRFRQQVFFSFLGNDDLGNAMPILQDLMRRKILPPNFSIYNQARIAATDELVAEQFLRKNSWMGTTGISGESMEQLTAVQHIVEQKIKDTAVKISFGKINAPSPFFGQPAPKNLKLAYLKKNKKEKFVGNPDLDACGLIWFCPVIPLEKKSLQLSLEICNNIFTKNNFDELLSIQIVNERYFYLIIPIIFDRTEIGEDEKAIQCHQELSEAFRENGFHPYRWSHLDREQFQQLRPENLEILKRLKKVFDPNDIIS